MEVAKIVKFNSNNLRNAEFTQFHAEVKDLVIRKTPQKLKIAPQFEAYLALYNRVDEAYKIINRSHLQVKTRSFLFTAGITIAVVLICCHYIYDAEAYYNMGLAHYIKGDYDKAIADYESALRIDPNDSDARKALEDIKRMAL